MNFQFLYRELARKPQLEWEREEVWLQTLSYSNFITLLNTSSQMTSQYLCITGIFLHTNSYATSLFFYLSLKTSKYPPKMVLWENKTTCFNFNIKMPQVHLNVFSMILCDCYMGFLKIAFSLETQIMNIQISNTSANFYLTVNSAFTYQLGTITSTLSSLDFSLQMEVNLANQRNLF